MKVSICIPTYNQAPYIELAIRSAFEQSLKPIEIIVSDDCSTDKTPEILKKLAVEIPVLKIISQPVNIGIAANVDACLRAAKGDYVIRLDSDDQLLPLYTEKLIKMLTGIPNAGYAHAAIQVVDQSGNLLNQRRLFRKTGLMLADEALNEALKGYRVAANLIMFKREALVAIDFLKGRPNFGEDYHMTAEIAAIGYGNIYLDEVLGLYRVWVDVGNVRSKRKLAEINGLRRVYEDVLEPAFKKRGWNLNELSKSRKKLAVRQSDCLSWDIYTPEEKGQLMEELYKLSSAPAVKFFVWVHTRNLGGIFKVYSNLKAAPKAMIKKLMHKSQLLTANRS